MRNAGLFNHYQDVFFLRVHVKYKDNKSTSAKEQFYTVQNFFKAFFAQDRKNEAIGGDVEFKKFTIAKWGRGEMEGISIAISANKEASDD